MTAPLDNGSGPRPQGVSFDHHPRSFQENQYVYAVLSRRAGGVSIGINLNPDKVCNFACIYCQVDRTTPAEIRRVDPARLQAELEEILQTAADRPLEQLVSLEGVPESHRRLADVAFSGDGEPTSHPEWAAWVETIGGLIESKGLTLPMTLITNASLFHRPRVKEGLDLLAKRGGQVWAKLDAGSEPHYRQVADTVIPFQRILDNISEEARRRPLVIQSLFYRLGRVDPPQEEIDAWAERLAEIIAGGGSLAGVQVTTVARRPPRPDVLALSREKLEQIAASARERLPGIEVNVYPASNPQVSDDSNRQRREGQSGPETRR